MNTHLLLAIGEPSLSKRRHRAAVVGFVGMALVVGIFLSGYSASRSNQETAPLSMTDGRAAQPAAAVASTALSSGAPSAAAVPLVEPRVRTSSMSIERTDGAVVKATVPSASPAAAPTTDPSVQWELQESGALRVSTTAPVDPNPASFGIRLTLATDPLAHSEALYVLCRGGGAESWDLVPDGPIVSVEVLQSGGIESPSACAGGIGTTGSE